MSNQKCLPEGTHSKSCLPGAPASDCDTCKSKKAHLAAEKTAEHEHAMFTLMKYANENPTLNALCHVAHSMSRYKGFWDGDNHNVAERLALIHSEVSEALEEARTADGLTDNKLRRAYWKGVNADNEPVDGGGMTTIGASTSVPLGVKPEGFVIELADVVIRVFDLCGKMGLDLEGAILLKMQYNATRLMKHGKKF